MNTTDVMITSFFDDAAIDYINKKTGLDLKQFSDGGRAGGPKVLSFEVFGTCRSMTKGEIFNLIEVFKVAPFKSPEYAVLFIDDDDEVFTGKVILDGGSDV